MSALAHGRLWRALIAVAFVLATAMPAFAAFQRDAAATMPPCASHGMGDARKPDCSGHVTKAMFGPRL